MGFTGVWYKACSWSVRVRMRGRVCACAGGEHATMGKLLSAGRLKDGSQQIQETCNTISPSNILQKRI
jgi:hypothetical protein